MEAIARALAVVLVPILYPNVALTMPTSTTTSSTSTTTSTTITTQPMSSYWEDLIWCESRNTNANTGNGYYGYFQFSESTWQGLGYYGVASDYDKDTQFQAAKELHALYGPGQWPNCP